MTESNLWDVIHAAVLRLRAEAGDAHETAADVEDWQQHALAKFAKIVGDAGHPGRDRLQAALGVRITLDAGGSR